MSAPNANQIAEWFRTLSNGTRNLRVLHRKLDDAMRRDATASADIDGYPRRGDQTPRGSGLSDPTPALALAKPERDRHHENTVAAWQALADAVDAVNRLRFALTNIDQLIGEPVDVEQCEILTDEPADYFTDVNGILTRPMRLCRSAYVFVRTYKRLPTDKEVEWFARTGRWKARTAHAGTRPV